MRTLNKSFIYTGQKTSVPVKTDKRNIEPYLPDQGLIKAVNLAILLDRPLLIMGEPGCGKTKLAEAVAFELYEKEMDDNYFEWHIKSTSKARDGLYRYNTLKKFHDSQFSKDKINESEYIEVGQFGQALQKSTLEKPAILLIDEIDKASIDFPNDLLLELDKGEFVIEETGEKRISKAKPIIFITSNREKELPPAFLRRCLFYRIEFPNKESLIQILNSHFQQTNKDPELIENAVKEFVRVREEMKGEGREGDKNVSTSELIDWFGAISHYVGLKKTNTDSEVEQSMIEDALNLSKSLPFESVLLKNWKSTVRIGKD